ncbi:MAG: UDP-N-acetylmuramate--L-alanine ligase [Pseudomonadota bacterium]|nr:UDP-N-acetylmuramate--L-alanine ligase [Pseudomonadota bacterium]
MKHAVQHLHFTGIGGAGMSAVAEVLLALGYRISGSDLNATAVTRRLQARGATVHLGHAAANIGDAQVVVTTAAAAADNAELQAARDRGIPVVQRAVMVAELMRRQQGIAVAGTHGKTTTTALVAAVLTEAGMDPSFIVGGTVQVAAVNGHLGKGEFIVAEADESDASFLHLNPVMAVVTNIDADHLETYGHSVAQLHSAFVDFIHRLPFYGRAVVCSDDPGVRAVLPRLQRPLLRYGLDVGADLRGVQVQALPGGGMRLAARQSGRADLLLTLAGSGLHNVRNALAAVAVGRELGTPDAAIARALAAYAGVGRRFERHGELPIANSDANSDADGGHYTLIDDYGHHPVELAAVLAAARAAFAGRRIVLAFEPHRYTRTRDCMAEFVGVFAGFDVLLLAPVYSAGEAPIAGADSPALMRAVERAGHPNAHGVDSLQALPAAIAAVVRDGDVVLTMGAGTIERVPQQLRRLAMTAGAL